jgi:hypothetical protein
MGIQLTPSLRALQLERGQLRACRWGFALVLISLLLQVSAIILLLSSPAADGAEQAPERVVTRESLLLLMVVTELPRAVAMLGAAGLFFWVARTPAWRQASWALAATIAAEILIDGVALALMGPSIPAKQGMPIGVRMALGSEQILRALEDWWLAVILAEFAAACRDTILLLQAERLGYGVLAALVSVMALVGWTTPLDRLAEDDFSQILMVATMATGLLVLFWLVRGLLRALVVGKILSAHLDQTVQNSASPPDERLS